MLAAAALLSACSSGGASSGDGPAGAPAPADNPFSYEVPSPPTATYQLADTNTMVMSMGGQEIDMAMSSSATLTLTFTADPGGVRVVGAVSDHSASMSSSMMGDQDLGGGGMPDDIEFVIGPLGRVEMISTPEIPGADALPATPFAFNASDMFPRFPGHPLQPGDTWADTTTVIDDSADSPDAEALGFVGGGETSSVYTYTLVGDTTVAGRTLHKIAVTGVGTTTSTATEVETGELMSSNMSNTLEGFYLWDAERRLLVLAELVRTADGNMTMPGMGATAMTMAGPSTMRLVN